MSELIVINLKDGLDDDLVVAMREDDVDADYGIYSESLDCPGFTNLTTDAENVIINLIKDYVNSKLNPLRARDEFIREWINQYGYGIGKDLSDLRKLAKSVGFTEQMRNGESLEEFLDSYDFEDVQFESELDGLYIVDVGKTYSIIRYRGPYPKKENKE